MITALSRSLLLRLACLVLAVCACSAGHIYAANPKTDPDPFELTIDENLATPEVPAKASATVNRHMQRIGAVYTKHGLEVKPYRKGEVLQVIVPCQSLFQPNDTVLAPRASRVLNAFKDLVKLPDLYKILIVVHSDNTGSQQYADELTVARANAIDNYFISLFPTAQLNLIPYGVGNDEPRTDNRSIGARESNRRVDFYIIPEKRTVEMARSNKL